MTIDKTKLAILRKAAEIDLPTNSGTAVAPRLLLSMLDEIEALQADAFALRALVAAGHVSQALVDRARTLPGAPIEAGGRES